MERLDKTTPSKDLIPVGLTVGCMLVLLGLVIWQGLNQPDFSTEKSNAVLPHSIGEIFPEQSILLYMPLGNVTVFIPANALGVSEGYVTLISDLINQSGDEGKVVEYIKLEYYDENGVKRSNIYSEPALQICFLLQDKIKGYQIERNQIEEVNWVVVNHFPGSEEGAICINSNVLGDYRLVKELDQD